MAEENRTASLTSAPQRVHALLLFVAFAIVAFGACSNTEQPCTPACRDGYTCSSGQCVSACNPQCAVGQSCIDGNCLDASSVTFYDYDDGAASPWDYDSFGQTWDHTGLSYVYENYTDDLTTAAQVQAIYGAMQQWTEACQALSFKIASSTDTADIKIRWATGDHGDGSGYDFDDGGTASGNILAHGFPPGMPLQGDLHFDDYETWSSDGGAGTINLGAVALHELGHVLGLAHSSDVNSVMYKRYDAGKTQLTNDDIAGIKALYACDGTSPDCAATCAGLQCGFLAGCNCGTCSGSNCVNHMCVAGCTNQCSSGQSQCSGQTVQTCGMQNGCWVWQNGQTCSGSQVCQSGQCVTTCTNQCSSGQSQCSGQTVQTCGMQNGCWVWQSGQTCSGSQVCQSGQCQACTPSVYNVTPTSASFNHLTTFTVSGSCLPSTLAAWIDQCAGLSMNSVSSTSATFSCTPSYSTGAKSGVVKDKTGGTQLYAFTVNVY